MGEGGIFRGDGGGWLKRMWQINAWAEPGGFKGRMPVDKVDKRHRPVGDGWAPPRIGNDGCASSFLFPLFVCLFVCLFRAKKTLRSLVCNLPPQDAEHVSTVQLSIHLSINLYIYIYLII